MVMIYDDEYNDETKQEKIDALRWWSCCFQTRCRVFLSDFNTNVALYEEEYGGLQIHP